MKKLLSLILSFIIIAGVIFIPSVLANAIDIEIEYNAGDRIIVSLGDSYSSGEGIDPFFGSDLPLAERVNNTDWLCHRSQNAWSGKLTLKSFDGKTIYMKDHRGSADKAGNWYFAAMSGAVTGNILDTSIIPPEDKGKKEYEYRFKNVYKITGFDFDWLYLINSKVEYLEGSVEIPPQLTVFEELGNKKADYVTITMGGNDVDFTGVVTTAVVNVPYLEYSSHNIGMIVTQPISNGILVNKLNKMVNEVLPDTIKRLEETYKRIAREAGNQAHIIVAGYPKIISKDSIDPIFTSSDAELINSKVSYFNNEIRKTVEKCQSEGLNISFVSVEEEFGDYGAYYLLPSKELINRIELVKEQDINEKFPVSAYSIHPNNKGAEVYAKCVQREIDRIESERTRIWGQVVDEKNNRVSGVKVILTDDNNEVNVTNTTDSNGNYGFELDYKKDRHYTVRFEKKGFETLVVTEDKGGNRITINSALTKLSGDYTEFSGRFFNYSKGGMYDIYLDDTGEFTVKYVKHDGYGSFKMESDGRFSPLTKTDDYTYTFTVESFQSDYEKEQENSHRYIPIPETDLKVGSEFRIYTRDAPDSVLPKSVIEWRNLAISMTYGTMINLDYSYILYDVSNDKPYFSEKSIYSNQNN